MQPLGEILSNYLIFFRKIISKNTFLTSKFLAFLSDVYQSFQKLSQILKTKKKNLKICFYF